MYNWELPDWPNFNFSFNELEDLLYSFTEEVGAVTGLVKMADKNINNDILVEILLLEALKSSQIEDEYLSRQDLYSSIRNNLNLNNPEERVNDKKASGFAKLLTNVRETYAEPIDEATLYKWHSLLVFRQRNIIIGGWRIGEAPMQVISGRAGKEEIHFEAPKSEHVPFEMKRFIEWFNDTAPGGKKEIKNGVIRSGIAHLYFESIHPFEDGNGRIGRAIAQKCLSQTMQRPLLLTLSNVIERDKKAYYAALKEGQRTNEITAWLKYFLQIALTAQREVKELFSFTIKKAQFYDRFRSQLNERQLKVIGKMFEAGKEGYEGGMTAKKYMGITKTSKATATRDLQELHQLDAFPFIGEGRNVNYQIIMDLYSLVFIPSDEGIKYVDGLKNELFKKIGWYHSRNSKAHITITEFVTNEDEIIRILKHLKEIASFEKPIDLNFEGVDSYPNGAVFLKPTEDTKAPLEELMERIQKQINIKNSYKSKDPHMSIARKLSNDKVEIALNMFADAKLDFNCANIVLRKFNPELKQYEIFSTDFTFLGLPPKPVAQTSLF